MSWLSKVTDIAGRAEELLNQIDNQAAVALNKNAKSSGARNESAVTLIDMEGTDTNLYQSERVNSDSVKVRHQRVQNSASSGGHYTNRFRDRKNDDELIAYLNDPNEATSSRCSSVSSRFSTPNQKRTAYSEMNVPTVRAENTAEDLQTRHADTLKCLHMKESQMAVMCVRLQEAEEANIKKDAQITELKREVEVLQKRSISNTPVNGESARTAKLTREYEREKKEFESREKEYAKRLEVAASELSEAKNHYEELKTKVTRLEMNEQSLNEEIRLAKYNLEANKHEFDEYKQRAQKILAAKENLLSSLKQMSSNGQESERVCSTVEVEELRCERDLLKEDVQRSQYVIYNLKGDIQEMENRLREEQRTSGSQREGLLEQIHQNLSQANHYKEQLERTQLEYEFLQAELRRQEEAVERKLAEKDAELMKLKEERKSLRRYETGEPEQKIALLSEKLIAKQTTIERLESEKRALELRLERVGRTTQFGDDDSKGISISMHEGGGISQQRLPFLDSSIAHSVPVRIAQMAVGCIDLMGIRLAVFMRSPVFRLFFFSYCILLHIWVIFILLTYSPEIHPL